MIKRQGRAKGVGFYAGLAFELVDCGDDDLLDGDTAATAIDQLHEHAKEPTRPFHGYYMGEHTWWGMKHNNYEGATRNCLIIAQPEMKHAGSRTNSLAQSVDLAPTLAELCRLPAQPGFQGRSLRPVLEDPKATVNDAAFSWYPKEGWLGVAMRTDEWRFVEWTKPGKQAVRELYDMSRDSQNDFNIADQPEYVSVCDSLSNRLREQFPVQEFKPPPARALSTGRSPVPAFAANGEDIDRSYRVTKL